MNKPVYLELQIIELSKTVKYEFWYDYVSPKYGEKRKLCCMDTCIQKNRLYLYRHCRSCLNKV